MGQSQQTYHFSRFFGQLLRLLTRCLSIGLSDLIKALPIIFVLKNGRCYGNPKFVQDLMANAELRAKVEGLLTPKCGPAPPLELAELQGEVGGFVETVGSSQPGIGGRASRIYKSGAWLERHPDEAARAERRTVRRETAVGMAAEGVAA